MIPINRMMNRRRILRGMMGGAAVSVGLPFLDCFLNTNGTALADGQKLPVVFGTWFWGLGLNPGRWEPAKPGKMDAMNVELQPLAAYKDKMNVFSGILKPLPRAPSMVRANLGKGQTAIRHHRLQRPERQEIEACSASILY